MEKVNSEFDKEEKILKNFEDRMIKVIDKLRRKVDWHHDFEMLKKDKKFIAEKPYSLFFNFEEALNHYK